MNSDQRNILVVGLPKTGKTTFIAALWDVVGSEEVQGSLKLERLVGEKQHLNELRNLWADCNEIPRTTLAGECVVSMSLRDIKTGFCADVSFPDMDGESFERQWTERVWSPGYKELVERSHGAILFIHPSRVKEARLIVEASPLIKRISGRRNRPGQQVEVKPTARAGEQPIPDEPAYAATQVQVVALLDFIQSRVPARRPFRLAVNISAWDSVLKVANVTPDAWLEKRLPLLHQYLVAHSDRIPFRVYGISAQGGELDQAEELRALPKPSDRIIVVRGEEQSHDITDPVRWVMARVE